MSAEEQKLDELEVKATELRKTRNLLQKQATQLRNERDKLNEESHKLRDKANKHREERDRVNSRVQEVKSGLSPLFEELEEKQERLIGVDKRISKEYDSKPSKSKIQRDLKAVEWEVMTTPTREMLEKEDELVARASRLRKVLDEIKVIERKEDERFSVLADKKATELEIRDIRSKIEQLSVQSQENHKIMLSCYEEMNEVRKKADEVHRKFIVVLGNINEINAELDLVMPQIRALKNGLRLEEMKIMENKRISVESRIAERKKDALARLEAGEKLSFDDMRLIYGTEDDEEE